VRPLAPESLLIDFKILPVRIETQATETESDRVGAIARILSQTIGKPTDVPDGASLAVPFVRGRRLGNRGVALSHRLHLKRHTLARVYDSLGLRL